MVDDAFELWLGHMGQDRPLRHRMHAAVNRAGGLARRARSSFTGARIGRGAGIGALLGSPDYARNSHRRVIIKARIVRLGAKGLAGAAAHMRYLQRDGTTREGQRGALYGPEDGAAIDGKAFLARGADDRHQFRLIVSAEDGAEYEDLKPLIRRWMKQVEHDLGTKLDWVAVDHFNTGHPHSHVIVRGKDDTGKDLVIARNYMTQGLRERAAELIDLDLGPRSPEELMRAGLREIEQERLTNIDRRLIRAVDANGLVRSAHHDGIEQSLRAGRLKTLEAMTLATEEGRGVWRLADDLEAKLRRMGEHSDIIRTMQRAMRENAPERSPADFLIYDPGEGEAKPVTGRVIERGLSDEYADRHYLIVDGIDGLSYYVDLGMSPVDTSGASIVRVAPVPVQPRQVDRMVVEVASANGGRYNIDLHLRHDPNASEDFAQAHVRRLEAIRRATGSVTREADGTWNIASDHLNRAEAYERLGAQRTPVAVEPQATKPLDQLVRHDGATWLDRLAGDEPEELGRGFGADVRKALGLRGQWLVEQQLADTDGETVRLRTNALATLQQRELRRVVDQVAREIGLEFKAPVKGEHVSGIYGRALMVGDAKYALIEKSREFTLVPWKPALERAVGKSVSGIVRDAGISWTIGRGRAGPEIGGA